MHENGSEKLFGSFSQLVKCRSLNFMLITFKSEDYYGFPIDWTSVDNKPALPAVKYFLAGWGILGEQTKGV